jgi:3-oxoacyl-[acyl-carrier-protein] synthase-3
LKGKSGRKGKSGSAPAGISHLAYCLPARSVTVRELAALGMVYSTPEQLEHLGFRRLFVADGETAYDLAKGAVRKVLRSAAVAPGEIDALIYASAIPEERLHRSGALGGLFRYPATALQYEFEMTRANVIGLAQAGCVSFLSAIRLASSLLVSEPAIHRVLCVSADALPKGFRREVLYNLISDGAAAALVERDAASNRIVSHTQVTKGYFWDPQNKGDQIVASYFATARHVILETLKKAQLDISKVSMVVPHNVNRKSWDILRGLLNIPPERFFGRNIARKGHTIAADNAINLCDAVKEGKVKRGDYLLLFTFGFGAHWACTILEH